MYCIFNLAKKKKMKYRIFIALYIKKKNLDLIKATVDH